jgi:hypothetical protein
MNALDRATAAKTLDDLMPVKMLRGTRSGKPPSLLKGVKVGGVDGIFVWASPVAGGDDSMLVLKGPQAEVALLFSNRALGGVVSRRTIATFLGTSNEEDINNHVGAVAEVFGITRTATILETNDNTGFLIDFYRPSVEGYKPIFKAHNDELQTELRPCVAEDAFEDIKCDLNPEVIVSRYQLLGEKTYVQDRIEEDYGRARKTVEDIKGINEHTPKLPPERRSRWSQDRGRHVRGPGTWTRSPEDRRWTRGYEGWKLGTQGWINKYQK